MVVVDREHSREGRFHGPTGDGDVRRTACVALLCREAEALRDIARFLAALSSGIPWHVSRFFPAYEMTDVAPTPERSLLEGRDIGREEGLRHVYTGNLPGGEDDTLCPGCGELLLERVGRSWSAIT